MATYAIGDVQGCYDALQRLLDKIGFEPHQDSLWFVGDLVNRGNKSLEVLRFIKKIPHVKAVLGNHDFHLLALTQGKIHTNHTLHNILNAPDCEELVAWVRKLPLLHYDSRLNFVMTHAGIYPFWNLLQAQTYAQEMANVLQSEQLKDVIDNIYGDYPQEWHDDLEGWDRLRFITNAFTRMRFCNKWGKLEFRFKQGIETHPPGFLPWFKIPRQYDANLNIVFGHWAALQGKTDEPHVFALDTGCVWGCQLTAMRLEDQQRYSVSCAV